jgi:hypothetical protein
MSRRRKLRKGFRLVTVEDEQRQRDWEYATREVTGTELCEVENCDGSCDRWHIL